MGNHWYIFTLIIIILLILSAFFSSAETSITSLNVIRIKSLGNLRNGKRKRARIVFRLVKNYNLTLTTILIGNTLVNLAIGSIATAFFIENFKDADYVPILATVIAALIVLVIGEVIPKSIAKLYPEKVAMQYAYILLSLNIFFYPLSFIFKYIQLKSTQPTSSETELIELISIIEKEGVLEKAERDLIESAIKFDEKSVSTAMQPLEKIEVVHLTDDHKTFKRLYLENHYTRIPVMEKKGQ